MGRAGIPRSVTMKISGHRIEAMCWYAIMSQQDIADAANRLEQRLNKRGRQPP